MNELNEVFRLKKLALEVLEGKYENGNRRWFLLGEDYGDVQKIVNNEICKEGSVKKAMKALEEDLEGMVEEFFSYENGNDPIKPNHYKVGNKDLIDGLSLMFPQNEFYAFMKGNVMRYVLRFNKKNGIEDLKKAKEFIDRLIEFEEEKKNV